MTTEEARAAKQPAQLIQKWRGRKSALRHNPRVIAAITKLGHAKFLTEPALKV